MATRLARLGVGSGAVGALSTFVLAVSRLSSLSLGIVVGGIAAVFVLLVLWLTSSDARAGRANLLMRGQESVRKPPSRSQTQ